MASIISKFTKLNLFAKTFLRNRQLATRFCNTPSNDSTSSDIVDINIDKMITEDDELNTSGDSNAAQSAEITSGDLADGIVAPIDINPWIDEELEKGGTTDMEYIEKEREEIHYPEPPKERSGYYEFEGIKIWLPKKMLTPATYRYRLTEEEQQTLPDDIRICKFEKFKPTS